MIRPLPVRREPVTRRPKMLPHYAALVEYVFNNRFAIGSQIQRRFPTWLRSTRTAQYQLAGLCRLGYLATAPVRSTGPHFPYVYCATNRGARLVRDAYQQLGSARAIAAPDHVKTVGYAFDSILHELMLTEFSLAVQRTIDDRGDTELVYSERRFFRRERQLRHVVDGRVRTVIPDYGFLVRMKQQTSRQTATTGPTGMLHLVEWDNGTMSLARIRDKYQQYHAWAESEQGREQIARTFRQHGVSTDSANFRLLVIARDKAREGRDAERLADLLAEALELPATMRDRIWLTTAEQLKRSDSDSAPLDAPLWLRARDARTWIGEYRQHVGNLSQHRGRRFSRLRRQHILRHVPNMPRHTLLPRPASATEEE